MHPLKILTVLVATPSLSWGAFDENLPRDGAAQRLHFDRVIAPLFIEHCLECHSGPRPKAGLDLATHRTTRAGGSTGPALVGGKLDDNLLWRRVRDGEMPPKRPLVDADKELLRKWIEAGAAWGTEPLDPFRVTTRKRGGLDWWSLQPVRRAPPPAVNDAGWSRNPIDAFILAKLQGKGLAPSPAAAPRVLIRRLHFDLVGLPPTPQEVEEFVAAWDGTDAEKEASLERSVDRLLASPHYGERWARHWLDVVRFGESDGFERNGPRLNAWHYRDWVVRALNADMPYDEFCRMQIAGDVLRAGDVEALKATGFLVAGIHNTVLPMNKVAQDSAFQDELEDLVGSVGQTFLGLTVNCSRCHDHKFDAISQKDYYRLASALSGVQHAERDVADGKASKFKLYAVAPKQPAVTRLLVRGQVTEPADEVSPAGLSTVASVKNNFGLSSQAPEAERRAKLAGWLTHPDNPLFTRVMVNRLWHYHFGTGLVETPNDFGFNGGRPSHPELLDWLAAEFAAHRYRLKDLHRLIVTSSTYRQGSAPCQDGLARDADGRLLWRKPPERLQAEVLRDSMLTVAGLLNREIGGRGFSDYRETGGAGTQYYDPFDPIGPSFHRRSLYRFNPRGRNLGLLDAFDCPDPASAAPRRSVTTTPVQALALWNGAFAMRMAETLATRLETEAPRDLNRQVLRAYQLALQRAPLPVERDDACQLVRQHGLRALGRALFNSNEFLTIE